MPQVQRALGLRSRFTFLNLNMMDASNNNHDTNCHG